MNMKNHGKFEEFMLELDINENSANFGLIYKAFMAAQSEWISPEKSLPPTDDVVFVLVSGHSGSEYSTGYYRPDTEKWYDSYTDEFISVKGWIEMPELPEPPE